MHTDDMLGTDTMTLGELNQVQDAVIAINDALERYLHLSVVLEPNEWGQDKIRMEVVTTSYTFNL